MSRGQDRQFVYFLLEAALGGDLYGMFSSHQETWLVKRLVVQSSQKSLSEMESWRNSKGILKEFWRNQRCFHRIPLELSQFHRIFPSIFIYFPPIWGISKEIFLHDEPRGSTSAPWPFSVNKCVCLHTEIWKDMNIWINHFCAQENVCKL